MSISVLVIMGLIPIMKLWFLYDEVTAATGNLALGSCDKSNINVKEVFSVIKMQFTIRDFLN